MITGRTCKVPNSYAALKIDITAPKRIIRHFVLFFAASLLTQLFTPHSNSVLFNMLFFFYWILYLGTSALIWTTAQARPRSSHGVIKRELGHFEERYINTLNYKLHNETVKLIGYKKIKIPLEEIDAFEDHCFTNYAELQKFDSNFYD
ncbi:hypothetical protein RirG_201450 [Rhizophagus irregularis DAOM 197198w]|uniref:Uncharacterized protein n=1 Tax=Rhizophagus irregularis (strain DAOM 197198w) TaxID=1432141 RepID=A0A015JSP0_RHIIW|nr:hypothetical protein RirG_201450 [Rhizophagus irregularis DAOM 197198w]